MKRNLTVLVLLVAWSLLFLPSFSPDAHATAVLNDMNAGPDPIENDIIMEDDGAPDDDGQGDPGDGTDGYGIIDRPDHVGPGGGMGNGDSLILDELRLILVSLIKLVF